MNINYYRKCLGMDLLHSEPFLDFFQRHCDSQLEIMFGMSVIGQYATGNPDASPSDAVWEMTGHLTLLEPFSHSPSGSGVSVAHLIPQYPHAGGIFDFALYISDDNGHELHGSKLAYLVEIDGFGVHRHRRKWDRRKSLAAGVRVLRFPEENFISVPQMALAFLWKTVWIPEREEDFADADRIITFP